MKYLEEVIVLYFKKQRSIKVLDKRQKALAIMDFFFTGKITLKILDSYKAYNTCVINVSENITKY